MWLCENNRQSDSRDLCRMTYNLKLTNSVCSWKSDLCLVVESLPRLKTALSLSCKQTGEMELVIVIRRVDKQNLKAAVISQDLECILIFILCKQYHSRKPSVSLWIRFVLVFLTSAGISALSSILFDSWDSVMNNVPIDPVLLPCEWTSCLLFTLDNTFRFTR